MCSCVPCLISFGFAFASVSTISDAVCALLFQGCGGGRGVDSTKS